MTQPPDIRLLTETKGKQYIDQTVGPKVVDELSKQPNVTAAAESAVNTSIQGKKLVQTTDPGVVKNVEHGNYIETVVSPAGKLLRGIRKDGSVELPVSRLGETVQMSEVQDGYLYAWLTPARKVLAGFRKDGKFEVGGQVVPAASTVEPYDVLLIAGQSNSTHLDTLPVYPEDADPRLFRWDSTTNTIIPLTNYWTYIGSSFAREYVKNQPPGRRVLIVDAGVGATGFTTTSLASPPAGYFTQSGGTWDRTLTSDPVNLYSQMISKTQAAMAAAGANARLAAMIWVQGESDTATGTYLANDAAGLQAAYAAKLDDLITTARTALGVASLPVIIGSMTPYYIYEYGAGTNREKVTWAHMDTPRRIQSTSFMYGPEDMEKYNDTIHFSAQANKVRGAMAIDALYRAKENVSTAKPLPPQRLRATRSGTTVTVKWEAPPARATAFTVEYSIDGAAWVALTLPTPLALFTSFTAAAGTAVRVRAKTTNESGTSQYTKEVAL